MQRSQARPGSNLNGGHAQAPPPPHSRPALLGTCFPPWRTASVTTPISITRDAEGARPAHNGMMAWHRSPAWHTLLHHGQAVRYGVKKEKVYNVSTLPKGVLPCCSAPPPDEQAGPKSVQVWCGPPLVGNLSCTRTCRRPRKSQDPTHNVCSFCRGFVHTRGYGGDVRALYSDTRHAEALSQRVRLLRTRPTAP